MFDHSAPYRQPSSRRPAERPGGRSDSNAFEIVALWGDDYAPLGRAIENAIDWGPFELVEMRPLGHGVFGALRILCRFDYHGEASARASFEQDLRRRLSAITCWKEIT